MKKVLDFALLGLALLLSHLDEHFCIFLHKKAHF